MRAEWSEILRRLLHHHRLEMWLGVNLSRHLARMKASSVIVGEEVVQDAVRMTVHFTWLHAEVLLI